jgi:hypothetical protein
MSRDECTFTRLNSVISTRKRPFTEECFFLIICLISNRIKYICVFYFHFFVFLDVLFRTFDVILQWRQNICHVIFHVWGFSWRKNNRFLHTYLGKTGWSSISDRNFISFREWCAAKRAKRNKHFYHEWKITRVLVRKAQISVESYLNYQSVSQKSILCDVYFIALNFMILIW